MESPDFYIKKINTKINLLITENKRIKEERDQLKKELVHKKNILDIEREKIKNLENQIKINNIAKENVEKVENVKEMREKINEIIREVDKSIRYLKS